MAFFKKFLISFAIFVAACYFGLTWFINSEVEKGFNQAIADIKGMTINYDDLTVSLTDQCVCLDAVAATLPDGRHLTADTLCIDQYDQVNPVPHKLSARATGVVMEADHANVGTWASTLRALDLNELKGDIALEYAYDPNADTLTVSQLTISMPGVGDIDLSGVLDSLDLEFFRTEKLIGLRIRDLTMTFANASFMDTLMRESGTWLGTSKDDARSRICAEITAMADHAGKDDNPVAEDALRGLSRYVNDPHTVTISAAPKEPVPVLYFFMGRDLYDNMRLMNVTVTTDSNEDI